MSDEAIYGKVSYRLPFSTAVAAGIIVPYKVIISVSLNKEVDAELLRRGSTRVRRDEIQAKWVANQIALKRAIEKTGASKIITFHSRVNLAEDFAGDDARGFKEHVKGFDIFHVNGSQNAADRKALLEGFKAAPKGLITNARCLTEGVDVPAVDMVAFVDPRKSKIDIAQAAGRAMRQSKATNKKLGYIVVPLFIEQKKGETEAEAFTRAGFDEVAEVLGAMLESDDDLVDTIEKMQEARGRGDMFNPRHLHDKIEVIGPAINLDKLTQSIDVEILDRLGVSWDRWFGLLQKFYKLNGHCRVALDQKLDELKLGIWVNTQRHQNRQKLTQNQIAKLDSLNFSWDPIGEQWEQAFDALKEFHKTKGHCRAVAGIRFKGIKLGPWISTQRKNKERLSEEQIRRLDSVGFNWDPHGNIWDKSFAALKSFYIREGHFRIARGLLENGVDLGGWVIKQRTRRNHLTQEQISRLDSIDFSWNPIEEEWDKHFNVLLRFWKKEGHCRVTQKQEVDSLNLGTWVQKQRAKKDQLSTSQRNRLNSLGFSWDPIAEQWEEAFAALKEFHTREGHCRVTKSRTGDGRNLSIWVIKQRAKKKHLSADQINRLNSIGFSWDPITEQWEEGFSALKAFHRLEGHCRVAKNYKANGFKLRIWVSTQRTNRKRLTRDQESRLNSLGFSWDPHGETWEVAFEALTKFYKREGHCRVTQKWMEGSVKLGTWVSSQRQKKAKLTPIQINRLNSLGFIWKAV